MMRTVGVVLAAGASRRFGPEDKLLAPLRGQPLVTWAADALMQAGCDVAAAIISSSPVADILPPALVRIQVAPGQTMAVSFQAAIGFAQEQKATRLLVCLGDMPHVTSALLRHVLASPGSAACVRDGVRLPPILLMAEDFERAAQTADGDRGARTFIQSLPPDALVELDAHSGMDVDVPRDLHP